MTTQITAAAEYGFSSGFVIEAYSTNHNWHLPAWEEMGLSDLDGVFSSYEAASAALDEVRS